jgi:hypothetical protein
VQREGTAIKEYLQTMLVSASDRSIQFEN